MVFKNRPLMEGAQTDSRQSSKNQRGKVSSISKQYLSEISHIANDQKAVGLAHHQPIGARLLKRRKKSKTYGRMANLEVRLAARKKEIKKAQRLRFKVFYEEMSAMPDIQTKMKRRDIDAYDKICDHLLVLDHEYKSKIYPFVSKPKIIATYRILSEEMARQTSGFYTQNEFDLAPMLERHKQTHKFLEVGRSCVLKPYRSKRSVELLWRGLWAYIQETKANAIIGCASFEGTDPKAHALALSFLHHHASAPDEWKVKAHAHRYETMNLIPKDQINMKEALKVLPPLIKGYLRLGAYIGEGAVIDHQFGTTDIMIILPTENISDRYINHFSAPEEKNTNPSGAYLN